MTAGNGVTDGAAPVVFLSHTGQCSGAEKVLVDVVREALRRGAPVVVMCPDGPLVGRLPAEVRRVAVPPLGLAGERGAHRVLALGRLGIDWLRAAATLRRLVRGNPGARVVVNSLMATPVLRLARTTGTWLVHDTVSTGKQRAALRIAGPAIGRAVAVSRATADALADTGIPTVVRNNGIELPVPDLSRPPADPPVVGILAALTPWKGHRLLLEAVATLPGVRLQITGEGFPGEQWYAEELRARAARPDLAGRVDFLGHVDPREALAGWDVAVNCSELPEAGPISVLEILGSGIPMVVTERTSYVFPGICEQVEPDDPHALAAGIAALLGEDDERRRARSEAGRRAVEQDHDLARTVGEMLDALLDVTVDRGGAR